MSTRSSKSKDECVFKDVVKIQCNKLNPLRKLGSVWSPVMLRNIMLCI